MLGATRRRRRRRRRILMTDATRTQRAFFGPVFGRINYYFVRDEMLMPRRRIRLIRARARVCVATLRILRNVIYLTIAIIIICSQLLLSSRTRENRIQLRIQLHTINGIVRATKKKPR